jgi:hypothetical protein
VGRWFQVRTVEKVAEKLLTVHSASSVFLSAAATSQKLHINYRATHYWADCTPGHAEALTCFHLSKILENCILMVAVAAPTVFIFTNEVYKSRLLYYVYQIIYLFIFLSAMSLPPHF